MPEGERRLLLALAGAVSLLLLVAGFAGHPELLVYAAPAALVAIPLLSGRYIGEERIFRLRRRFRGERAQRGHSRSRPRGRPSVLAPRGTSLMAHGLAVRPPPPAAG
jgi:hypothetical protein